MAGQPIIPKGSAPPLAPYRPGMKAGNVVYVSGTLAINPKGKPVGIGDVKVQTRYVLESVKGVIESTGGRMSDIVF